MKRERILMLSIIFSLICSNMFTLTFKEKSFLKAVKEGKTEKVEKILAKKPANFDINCVDSDGDTALHLAITAERMEIVELLLAHNISIDSVNNSKVTPAGIVVIKDRPDLVVFLLEKGAGIQPENAKSLVSIAVSTGRPEVLKMLVDQFEADLSKDKYLLLMAAMFRQWEILEYLIEQGLDINETEGKGRGLLRYASGNLEILELLLKKGINVNNIPDDGLPPISSAVVNGEFAAAELFLKYGADLNISFADKSMNKTPLPPIIALGLDDEGSKITALAIALKNGHKQAAMILLENGADPNVETIVGTPISIAREKKYTEVVEYIEAMSK